MTLLLLALHLLTASPAHAASVKYNAREYYPSYCQGFGDTQRPYVRTKTLMVKINALNLMGESIHYAFLHALVQCRFVGEAEWVFVDPPDDLTSLIVLKESFWGRTLFSKVHFYSEDAFPGGYLSTGDIPLKAALSEAEYAKFKQGQPARGSFTVLVGYDTKVDDQGRLKDFLRSYSDFSTGSFEIHFTLKP